MHCTFTAIDIIYILLCNIALYNTNYAKLYIYWHKKKQLYDFIFRAYKVIIAASSIQSAILCKILDQKQNYGKRKVAGLILKCFMKFFHNLSANQQGKP